MSVAPCLQRVPHLLPVVPISSLVRERSVDMEEIAPLRPEMENGSWDDKGTGAVLRFLAEL